MITSPIHRGQVIFSRIPFHPIHFAIVINVQGLQGERDGDLRETEGDLKEKKLINIDRRKRNERKGVCELRSIRVMLITAG